MAVAPAMVAEQPRFVSVSVRSNGQEVLIAGVAAAGAQPRITYIDGFTVDVMPRRTMLVLTNADVPGVIGRVGTVLGDAGVNIAEYHQARRRRAAARWRPSPSMAPSTQPSGPGFVDDGRSIRHGDQLR